MSGLSIEYRDEGLCAASWGSLVVFVWSGPVSAKRVEACAAVRHRALECTEGIGSALHIHAARRVPRPDEAVTRRAKDVMAQFAPGTIGQAHVIEAEGFKGKAVRSMIENMRSSAPLHVSASIDDAIDWLVELDHQDPMMEIYRDALCEDVRELAASVADTVTAA